MLAPGQPIARRPGQPINVAPGPASAEMTPVKSSAVDSYHYDPQAQVLTVRTQSGGYRYAEVTPEEFSAFVRADSKGRAYNVIKNNHTQISYDKGFGWRFSHPTIPQGEEETIRTMSLGDLLGK